MRTLFVFLILAALKVLSRIFYRVEMTFEDGAPARPWQGIRLVAVLNHTSLFEPIFVAGVPFAFLWRLARHGVIPAAAKTMDRPMVGMVFRALGKHVIPISRERDATWQAVLDSIEPESMVVIAPEGRMKRRNGLDRDGKPMTVRGGIADVIAAIPDGRFLVAFSGGLHHIQAPGDRFPKLFKRVLMKIENLSIADYRAAIQASTGEASLAFKRAVITDLELRRDRICGPMELELLGGQEAREERAAVLESDQDHPAVEG